MISAGIFHTPPPSDNLDFDPERDEFEASWLHIKLVSEFLRYLESSGLESTGK